MKLEIQSDKGKTVRIKGDNSFVLTIIPEQTRAKPSRDHRLVPEKFQTPDGRFDKGAYQRVYVSRWRAARKKGQHGKGQTKQKSGSSLLSLTH